MSQFMLALSIVGCVVIELLNARVYASLKSFEYSAFVSENPNANNEIARITSFFILLKKI